MHPITLKNAKVISPSEVVEDCPVVIEDGVIVSLGKGCRGREIDLGGDYLMPGLIDLHCDAIEKEVEPRSGVIMPFEFAVRQIDNRNLIAGITTAFHSFSFAGGELGIRNVEIAERLICQVREMDHMLSVRNRNHARYEITCPEAMPAIQKLIDDGNVDLLSIMDHTPGQGQFWEGDSYKRYLMSNYGRSGLEADAIIAEKRSRRETADQGMKELASHALANRVAIASHDDDSPRKVAEMIELGVTVSEFPINMETAREVRNMGLHSVVGAPNAVRGKSQSNGISALEAIANGAADCLCSDYIPATLLCAVFRVVSELEWSLPDAVALVTCNPAEAVGLGDRGQLAEGMSADLISVRLNGAWPETRNVWVDGERKFSRDR